MKNMSLLLFMALSSAYLYADADELRKQVQAESGKAGQAIAETSLLAAEREERSEKPVNEGRTDVQH